MRFQRDSAPTPYLNRKDQYRMLGLLGMLFLVVLAIDFARRPENWAWMFPDEQQQQELRELSLDDLDFNVLEPENGNLAPDTFRAVPNDERPLNLTDLGLNVAQIPPELLEEVQDRRVGLLRSEAEAMTRVLNRVRTLSQTELEEAAASDIGFRVVFTDAEQHRGRLIRLDALLWRLQPYPHGDPETTEDDLWQAWMFTSDSGKNPWVAFLAEKPDELEIGEGINRPVQVVGYFFKNYGYATNEGLHIAPMLIAKSLKLQPLPELADNTTENLSLYVFTFLMTIGMLFGLMIWWFVRSDRKFDRSRLAQIADERHPVSPELIAELSKHAPFDPTQLRIGESEPSQADAPHTAASEAKQAPANDRPE